MSRLKSAMPACGPAAMSEALDFHPLANLFPLIEGQAFDDLVADIRANGIREPVVLWQGKILDGRNRYRAAVACGLMAPNGWQANGRVSPINLTRQFMPQAEGDPLAFVLSLNLHRRHLTTSQRAMIAAQIGRIGHGGNRSKASYEGLTLDARATQLSVGRASVERAEIVVDKGVPELCDAVKAGTVTVAAASDLATLPKDQQLAALRSADADVLYKVLAEERARKQALKRERRDAREADLGERIASGNAALVAAGEAGKRYGVIYADPEWRFEPYSRDTGMDRAADNHYPTSPLDVIASRPVRAIAARDCALFLWATRPMLPQALTVVEAWGFAYKSCTVWGKRRDGEGRGPGYIFTDESELLLYATRGDVPAPAPGAQWPSLIIAPVGGHSQKPHRFRELIESYFPNLPKIELNAREQFAGWDSWGAEAPAAGTVAAMGRPVAAELDGWAAEAGCVELPAWPARRVG